MALADFQKIYETVTAAKPANANIGGHIAQVGTDGVVSIRCVTSDVKELTDLRDWLTSLIGS